MKLRLLFAFFLLAVVFTLTSLPSVTERIFDLFIPPSQDECPHLSFDDKRGDGDIVGVWIASVSNIDFPSSPAKDEQELKKELDSIVEYCSALGVNTIFFQVRPTSDALYISEIFPLSVFLTGGEQRMATSEDFDALAYITNRAHEKGIALHAWVNPMRISSGTEEIPHHDLSALCDQHPAVRFPEYVVKSSNGCMYYDVGIPEVRELITDGVREIVYNYDIDGVIFDDYFYPYDNASFDDSSSYEKYGNGLSLGDFRRESVSQLVSMCSTAIKESGKNILFGISPFGVWKNDTDDKKGSHTNALSAYSSLYYDALDFAKKGYVDYIAPQLYWTNDNENAPYDVLCEWWSDMLADAGTAFLVAHAAHKYTQWESPAGVLLDQYEQASKKANYRGSIFFGFEQIKNNLHGASDEIMKIAEKSELKKIREQKKLQEQQN